LPPGCEKSTLPWSAPVGHRQPQLTDVTQAKSLSDLDEENAKLNRVVKGICRGCWPPDDIRLSDLEPRFARDRQRGAGVKLC
jgi:hypothetical protein